MSNENIAGMLRSLARNIECGNVVVDYWLPEVDGKTAKITIQMTGEPSLQIEDLAEMMQREAL